jgi:hypothetical protein
LSAATDGFSDLGRGVGHVASLSDTLLSYDPSSLTACTMTSVA